MPNPRDVLHEAQVSSNNIDSASSRVAYDDLNGHVSSDTQTMFPAMGRWQMFFLPKVGDHVAVLRLPNGKQEGFVVGTYNTAENMPINPADGLVQLISEDLKNMIQMFATEGNFNIKFREKMHQKCKNSEINVIENIKQTSETLDINAGSTIIIIAGDSITVQSGTKITIQAPDIEISGGNSIKMTAPRIDIN